MCARYTRAIDSAGVDDVFDTATDLDEDEREEAPARFDPTWNAAPGTDQLIVTRTHRRFFHKKSARWGVSAPSVGRPLVNARSESVHLKEAFRRSFERHRCIVPATGFYEWSSRNQSRTPNLFVVGERVPFAMAGICTPPVGVEPARFCILTTEPNESVASVHDRMPVILQQPDIAKWLDPEADLADLRSLLVPFSGPMRSWAVSKKVNGTRVDGPELTRPWSDPQLTLF